MARTSSSDRETQFARAVLTQNLKVRPGENVIIEGWSHALPWAVALAREARRLKAHPIILYEDEDSYWDSVEAGEDEVLGAAPAHEWAALGKTDVYIHMWGAGDKVRMNQLPEERTNRLVQFNDSWYDVANKVGLRGSRLEIGRPFPSLAKAYVVDQEKWIDQLVEATLVSPKQLEASGAPIARALARGRTIRIHDDHGTDLKLGLANRKVQTDYGLHEKSPKGESRSRGRFRVLTSLPAGTLRVSLDESAAEGTIKANRPSYNDFSASTGGIFRFRKGRLVYHHYDTSPEMFDGPYATGGKGRDRPGYLAIGLNPKLHGTPQLEDREAGAITIGVGNNTFLGDGKNKSPFSGIVVNVGATLEIDGKRVPLPG